MEDPYFNDKENENIKVNLFKDFIFEKDHKIKEIQNKSIQRWNYRSNYIQIGFFINLILKLTIEQDLKYVDTLG